MELKYQSWNFDEFFLWLDFFVDHSGGFLGKVTTVALDGVFRRQCRENKDETPKTR